MISRPFRQYIFIAIVLLIVTLFSIPITRAEGVVPPKVANTMVQDHSNVLSPEQETQLQSRVQQFKQTYDVEVGLMTIPTLHGFGSAQQLATAAAREYGIGSATSKHGVLVLIVTADRKYFIAPSIHSQGVLTDGKVGTIGRTMIPNMKQGDWAAAFNIALAGLEPYLIQLHAESNTVASGATAPVAVKDSGIGLGWTLFLFLGLPIGFIYLGWRIFRRKADNYVTQRNNYVRRRVVSGDLYGRNYTPRSPISTIGDPFITQRTRPQRNKSERRRPSIEEVSTPTIEPSTYTRSSHSSYSSDSSSSSSSDSGGFSGGGSFDGGGAGGDF